MQKFLLVSWNISEPIKKKKEMNKKIILVHSKLKYRQNIWGKILFLRKACFKRPALFAEEHFPF